jgi:type I restriction enzyme S subunit
MDVRDFRPHFGLLEKLGRPTRASCQKGFKQTEAGLIPTDWRAEPAGSLVECSSPICYGVVQVGQNIDTGVPIVAIKFVKEIARAPLHRAADILEKPYARSRVKANDVLISIKGTIGRVGIVPEGFEGNISRELARLRLDKSFSPAYVAQQLESTVTRERISRAVVGTTRLEFSIGTLRQFEIPVPPTLAEQEAIAGALTDVDALINSLEQLLVKKRQIKQGAMQELLTGKKRLPGFRRDWVIKRLGDIADIRSGGTPSTSQPQFWDGDIPWCTPTDVTALAGRKYLTDTNRKISTEGLKASSAELIPANSITMTSRATIGECAINKVPVTTNQGFKNFVPGETVDTEFLYYLLLTQKTGFVSLCGGSTFLEIGKSQLDSYELRVPIDKAEQERIAAVLADMDTEISALEFKLVKARQIKQGMMQELLTGRIRLV